MQVVQTDGVPPNQGNIMRPIIGCTKKSKNALRKAMEAATSENPARELDIDGDTIRFAQGPAATTNRHINTLAAYIDCR
jgi:hypothetical protein